MSLSPSALAEGMLLFDRGEYFQAHEVWEELWRITSGPERELVQGLIQAAVSLHHHHNRNRAGEAKMRERALDKLQAFAPIWEGIDVQRIIDLVATPDATSRRTFPQ